MINGECNGKQRRGDPATRGTFKIPLRGKKFEKKGSGRKGSWGLIERNNLLLWVLLCVFLCGGGGGGSFGNDLHQKGGGSLALVKGKKG